MQLKFVSIMVSDQERALDFYTINLCNRTNEGPARPDARRHAHNQPNVVEIA